jgi:hypothetical protein
LPASDPFPQPSPLSEAVSARKRPSGPFSVRERILLNHLNSYGAAIFPKQKTIAKKLNLGPGNLKWSLRTVNRVMQKLKDRDRVEAKPRGPTSSLYMLKKQEDTAKVGVASEKAKKVEKPAETPKNGVAFGVASAATSLLMSEEEFRSERHQHHRIFDTVGHKNADEAVVFPKPSSAFARSIETDFGRRLSRSDAVFCGYLEWRGLEAATVCAGVVVGRARKLCSDKNRGISDPIQSLRYFANCIEQAARGEFSPSYVDHLRSWLSRHGKEIPATSGGRAGETSTGPRQRTGSPALLSLVAGHATDSPRWRSPPYAPDPLAIQVGLRTQRDAQGSEANWR